MKGRKMVTIELDDSKKKKRLLDNETSGLDRAIWRIEK